MKRKERKLGLSRETLRALTTDGLHRAVGGDGRDAVVRFSDTCKDTEYLSCTYVCPPPPPAETVA